ncbi:MAG: hypothetical protein ISQ08_08530 [Planctomycetes bacterium]|nr:hypothetical protein [Planctomycetota bacterium]MDA0948730.1 hypothetical protein [Planctomycetota bacterium]
MTREGSEVLRVLALLLWAGVLAASLVCVVLANQARAMAVDLQRLSDASTRYDGEAGELELWNRSQLWDLQGVERAPADRSNEDTTKLR